jgi:hypothetical protein
MKKILLAIAALALSASAFAQVETSGLDAGKNITFMQERLYKLPEFAKGTVIFDQDAAVYEDDGTPMTLHPSQGIINVNNLHQCVVMINGNDTIPLLYEDNVVKVNTGKSVFLKIKGIYYEVLEYNDSILGFMQVLTATDMGKKDAYGTSSQLSSVTNISSLSGDGASLTTLTGNTDMRYTYEQRPVFIHGKKVAYLNEKQLCKMYKKKSAIIKEYFATHDVDQYSVDQARELYKMILQ